jgi:hypothetical protein
MMIIMTRVGELSDQQGNAQPAQQRHRQLQPIVPVELQFRQQVSAGNAQKRSGAERQGPAEPRRMLVRQTARPCEEQQRSERSDRGKREIDEMPRTAAGSRRCHQSKDRKGAERFMQDYGQRGPQTKGLPMAMAGGGHRRCNGQAIEIENRVERQAQGNSNPA